MTDKIDVAGLAKLARLEVTDAEITALEKELPGILAFVETIQKADVADDSRGTGHRNVYRADANPHEGGLHSETLLSAAPSRNGNRIAVKQVISRKPAQEGSADRK